MHSIRVFKMVRIIPIFLLLYPGAIFADDISGLVEKGKELSHNCTMCHTFDKGGHNRFGPNLWNIVGSPIANVDGYPFSDTLVKMHSQTWTDETLDRFLTDPQAFAPGTKMSFRGMKNPEDRANLIAWLRTLSDNRN